MLMRQAGIQSGARVLVALLSSLSAGPDKKAINKILHPRSPWPREETGA